MLGWCAVLIKVYFFWKKTIALLQLLHYCNSFLGGQLLHIAIFNRFFFTTIAIANALVGLIYLDEIYPDIKSTQIRSRCIKTRVD